MSQYVTNRLSFKSNSKTILIYLKSKSERCGVPGVFSLNSIKATPEQLNLGLTPDIKTLSIMNADRPDLKGKAKQVLLAKGLSGRENKATKVEIQQKIEEIKAAALRSDKQTAKDDLDLLEKALANYRQLGFFSFYDWRITHWGVAEDIHSVVPSTFEMPTDCIEFETVWNPPITALNNLADTFPSVRFVLQYRYTADDVWSRMELFPAVPFGY